MQTNLSLKVKSVRLTTVAHATEDVGKIVVAIRNLSTREVVESKIEKIRLKGHYGNAITTLTLNLMGAHAETFFRQLWTRISKNDQSSVIKSLETRLDPDGRFYLRIDKQAALQGKFRLTEQDPIKLEVSFNNGHNSFRGQTSMLRQMLSSEGDLSQVGT